MTDTLLRLTPALAGRYRIERELGRGGMATVYLAHDERHDRPVAIKVLHPELGAALGVERFLSEIKTTARLQHPHILPLLDSGEVPAGVPDSHTGGVSGPTLLYYVMPYVAGETLRARLERERQLPVRDALRIGREVADALGAAHTLGIVHRDIKPENILLAGGGSATDHGGGPRAGTGAPGEGRAAHALVADFGIALAVQQAGGQRMTQTGLSLGTPQYMAPEQAMGEKAIDARADVYALGAVVYEMLAGEPPFTGPTAQAIVAKVLTEDPRPLTALRRSVPPQVADAVHRALEKLPADRLSTAYELGDALREAPAGPSAPTAPRGRTPTRAPRPSWRRPVPLLLGAAVLATIAVAGVVWRWTEARRVSPRPVVRLTVDVPRDVNVALRQLTGASVAISADGRIIAFVGTTADGTRRVFVRPLDQIVSSVLPGTEGGSQPFFSPDGRWIAFWAAGRLQKVALAGGAPQPITDLPEFTGATWTTGGDIVFAQNGRLLSVPSTGGAPRVLTAPDSAGGDLFQQYPIALPDGDHLLYSSWGTDGLRGARIGVVSLATGRSTRLDVVATFAVGVIAGHLIVATTNNSLLAVPFDVARRRVGGGPTPVVTGVAVGLGGAAKAALSSTGTLVYFGGARESELVVARAGGLQSVLSETRDFAFPRYSPDGRRLAITISSGTTSDVWLYDFASRTPTRLSTGGASNERPEWTPDGSRVLYRTDRGNRSSIWWQPADMSGPATPILPGGAGSFFEAVMTPDGRALVYQIDTTGADIEYRMLEGDTTPRTIAASRSLENMPRVSPDGRWVAFVTDESGSNQVVVQPLPGPGPRIQVSTNGGTEPVWAPDGRRLFYRGGRKIVAATVTTAPTFSVTARTDVLDDIFLRAFAPHANYDVTPDGSGLLLLKGTDEQHIVVVHNWADELRARLAAGTPQR